MSFSAYKINCSFFSSVVFFCWFFFSGKEGMQVEMDFFPTCLHTSISRYSCIWLSLCERCCYCIVSRVGPFYSTSILIIILQNNVHPFGRASFELVQQLCCSWNIFGHLQEATPAARFVEAYSVRKEKERRNWNCAAGQHSRWKLTTHQASKLLKHYKKDNNSI